jgi:hypothetical protein
LAVSEGFERTLQTATDAAATARLLERASRRAIGADQRALLALAGRYSDYALAQRETVGGEEAPAAVQVALL